MVFKALVMCMFLTALVSTFPIETEENVATDISDAEPSSTDTKVMDRAAAPNDDPGQPSTAEHASVGASIMEKSALITPVDVINAIESKYLTNDGQELVKSLIRIG